MKNLFFLAVGLVIIFGSIFLFFEQALTKESKNKILKINDTSIAVEVADTSEAREKGLSGRDFLPDGEGMMFVFDKSDKYGFWMKDMKFAIDIIWIDNQFRIIGIEREVSPKTFPQAFYPNQPIRYVLELPAGAVDKYNIVVGAVIQYK